MTRTKVFKLCDDWESKDGACPAVEIREDKVSITDGKGRNIALTKKQAWMLAIHIGRSIRSSKIVDKILNSEKEDEWGSCYPDYNCCCGESK